MVEPTTTSNTMSYKQNENRKIIQHAGRVHVRGMIRRVWRPRYLELDEDGILRYYEATTSCEGTDMPSVSIQSKHPRLNSSKIKDFFHIKAEERTGNEKNNNDSRKFAKSQGTTDPSLSRPLVEKRKISGDNDSASCSATAQISKSVQTSSSTIQEQTRLKSDLTYDADEDETDLLVTDKAFDEQFEGTQSKNIGERQLKSTPFGEGIRITSWDHISDPSVVSSNETREKDFDSSSHQAPVSNMGFCNESTEINRCEHEEDRDKQKSEEPTLGSHLLSSLRLASSSSDLQTDSKRQLLESTQNPPHHIHKDRPKTVMTILSARTIDGNSLRDIHIGLPKGRFGFVFRGQPLFSPNCNFDINSMNRDECELSEEQFCRSLSILATEHDYFATSRDYLCSVSTLEEAESWVVALRWAAAVSCAKSNRQKRRQMGLLFLDEDNDTYQAQYDSVCDEDGSYEVDEELDSCLSAFAPMRKKNVFMEDYAESGDSINASRSLLSISSAGTTDNVTSIEKSSEGVIAVPKVTNIRLKDRKHFFSKYDFMYEVHILVMPNIHLCEESKNKRSSHDTKLDDFSVDEGEPSVEERIILRSYEELVQLVDDLFEQECGKDDEDISSPRLTFDGNDHRDKELVSILRRSQLSLVEVLPKFCIKDIAAFNPLTPYNTVMKSVKRIDSLLRTLATHERLCNTTAMRNFLCLSHKEMNESRNIMPNLQVPKTRTLLMNNESTEDFVKKWLFGDSDRKSVNWNDIKMVLFLILNNPLIEACVWSSLIFLAKCVCELWFKYIFITVTLRVDYLIAGFCGTFYGGYKFASSQISYQKVSENDDSTNTNALERILPQKQRVGISSTKQFSEPGVFDVESGDVTIGETNIGREFDDRSTLDDSQVLSSPLPSYPNNEGISCWSCPKDNIFKVRGINYLKDRVKVPSSSSPFKCRGVDIWLTDNAERHIARHPSVLGGKLAEEDTFLVNFLLPFANFVSYFTVPPVSEMPDNVAKVWTNFISGDQQYRDARLKLLPVVIDGPWIVKKAVGNTPAMLGQKIPLQYYFTQGTENRKGVYEVDVIITASKIANGILHVVKNHTKRLIIAFAFIIEAATESELPETVICSFQIHNLYLELCPQLPHFTIDDTNEK